MKTYYVAFGWPMDSGVEPEEMNAKSIDNLRKNITKKLKVGWKCFVYTDKNDYKSYIGMMGNLGKPKNGWPQFMWIAKSREYIVNPKNGTIRRFM